METSTTAQEIDATMHKKAELKGVEILLKALRKFSVSAQAVAGITLAFMMVVTLSDVILRAFGKPITGAYELISFSGGIVVGLAIPYTSWMKGHIYVDVLVDRSPRRKHAPFRVRDIINILTRCVGIALFLLIGWSFFAMGGSLYESREVSQTLRLPFYPIAYGLSVSCFLQAALLLFDILRIVGGEYE